jgi:hypothetical protein
VDARLTVLQSPKVTTYAQGSDKKQIAAGHGSFDNDVDVVTATLQAIVGGQVLQPPVSDLRGF